MPSFQDKVLVITGACGGIASATARLFFNAGAKLLLADIDELGVQSLAKNLDPTGERVIAVHHDARCPDSAASMAARCRDYFGHADFLVNGAGIYRQQLVSTMSDEQWRETMTVNLDGVFFISKALIPLLREGGAIVNIASIAGHKGSQGHAHYAATKGALLSFTKSLALELGPAIRVNAVSPGIIDTPMVRQLMAQKGPQLLQGTPLNRLGTTEEVAGAVAFLCSDWAGFITGETIHVNGGLYMAG